MTARQILLIIQLVIQVKLAPFIEAKLDVVSDRGDVLFLCVCWKGGRGGQFHYPCYAEKTRFVPELPQGP